MTPTASNFHVLVGANYNGISYQEDHETAYDAALAANCRINNVPRTDVAIKTMVGNLIAEAGVQSGPRQGDIRMTG